MGRIGIALPTVVLLMGTLGGCVEITKVSYFPDQRGPFYCRITDTDIVRPQADQSYEVIPLPNWRKVFALRKPSTNEVIILTNNAKVESASAHEVFEDTWFSGRKLIAVKLLIIVAIENDSIVREEASHEISRMYPDAKMWDSVISDVVVDLYTIWLGSEYTRAPCQGVAIDSLAFELTLPSSDGAEFLAASSDALQVAGQLLYRDARSGWRFQRGFTLTRGDFVVSN